MNSTVMRAKAPAVVLWEAIFQRPLVLIILIAVSLRVSVAFVMGNAVVELPGIFDQISYHNLALRVVGGHGFTFGEMWWPITAANAPTAHWSFLYTLFLALIYKLIGLQPIVVRLIQAVLVGVLHPWIIFRIGEKVFNRGAGLAAAAISAIYVYFFYYGAALMTEPFYITGILFSLYLAIRLAEEPDKKRNWSLGLALGISVGITLLLRQVFLLFLPFLFGWIWIRKFRLDRRLPLAATLLCLAVIGLFVAPVTLYNYSRFGRFVLLNTNSGYAFFWGNNPIYGTRFIPILSTEEYREMIPVEVRNLDEAALDQELLRRGVGFVMDDPERYLRLSLSRIPPYFMFWYSPDSSRLSNISRIGSFGVFLPFMLYGLILAISRRQIWDLLLSPEGLLMGFGLVYSAIHILTWTLIRYRLPVDSVLIVFAGMALLDLGKRVLHLNKEPLKV